MMGADEKLACVTAEKEEIERERDDANENHRGAHESWKIERERAEKAEAQRDGWRNVAHYFLGDFTDTHTPEECREEALSRSMAPQHEPAFADMLAKCDALTTQVVALRAGLEGLRYGQEPQCWCDVSIDNPMQRGHSAKCDTARALLASPNPGAGWVSPEEHEETVQGKKDYLKALLDVREERDSLLADLEGMNELVSKMEVDLDDRHAALLADMAKAREALGSAEDKLSAIQSALGPDHNSYSPLKKATLTIENMQALAGSGLSSLGEACAALEKWVKS